MLVEGRRMDRTVENSDKPSENRPSIHPLRMLPPPAIITAMASHSAQDFLSPQQLQAFVAGLAGLSPDEIRKAKQLYLRNALSEYMALRASFKAFGVLQIIFAIIPFFWPILWMQRISMNASQKLYQERITNALAVWKDDLGDDAADFERQLAAVVAA